MIGAQELDHTDREEKTGGLGRFDSENLTWIALMLYNVVM